MRGAWLDNARVEAPAFNINLSARKYKININVFVYGTHKYFNKNILRLCL